MLQEAKIPKKTIQIKNKDGSVKSNIGRTNVFGGKDCNNEVHLTAMVLGLVKHYFKGQLVESTATRKFPELHKILKDLIKAHNPKFKFTSIQINKNVNNKCLNVKHSRCHINVFISSSFSRSGPRANLQRIETYFEKNPITVTFSSSCYLHGVKLTRLYFLLLTS